MIWDWIVSAIPAWLWIVGAVIIASVVVIALRQGGWKWAIGILIAGAAGYMQARSYRRGAAAERAKQDAADQHARDVIAEKKEDVRVITDEDRDRRFDRWSRKP